MATVKLVTFTGKGQAGNLLDGHNWAGGVAPGNLDTAVIVGSVGGTVNGTVSVDSMMFFGSAVTTFTGTLDTLGIGTHCEGLMVCDGAETVFAPGATLNDGGVLIVGIDATGSLLAQGAGTAHSVINTAVAKLGAEGDAAGTVTIDDGTWNNSGDAVIGNAGKGTLNVLDNGAAHLKANAYLGIYAGSTASMTIASGGSVNVTGLLRVGASGIASASVASGTSLTVGSSLVVGSGSKITIGGGTVTGGVTSDCIRILAGGVISGFGTVATPDGIQTVDSGKILATGGTLTVAGNIVGSGTVQIAANSTAVLTGSLLNLAGIGFIGANASLSLAHGAWVAPITGFALGDTISMASVTGATFAASTGLLKLLDNGMQVGSLHMAGTFAGDTFAVHQSGSTGIIALQHS